MLTGLLLGCGPKKIHERPHRGRSWTSLSITDLSDAQNVQSKLLFMHAGIALSTSYAIQKARLRRECGHFSREIGTDVLALGASLSAEHQVGARTRTSRICAGFRRMIPDEIQTEPSKTTLCKWTTQ